MKLYHDFKNDKNEQATCNITLCHLLSIKEISSVMNLISSCGQGDIQITPVVSKTSPKSKANAADVYCSKEALIGEHNQKPLPVIDIYSTLKNKQVIAH